MTVEEKSPMHTRIQLFCAWCIPAFIVVYLFGFIGLSGFVPPPSPTLSAEEVAAIFEHSRNAIRAGQLICMVFSGLLYIPFTMLISVHMARVEGRYPLLAGMQLVGNSILCVYFILCSLMWSAVAFRPEYDPQFVRFVNDATWLIFVMMYPTYVVALLSMAVCGLIDKREQPIFPRWFCFLTLWVVVGGVWGGFATFFKTGPFAWDGLLGFWVPVGSYLVWLLVLFPLLLKLVKRAALEEAAG
jgi:hypothetical protein